VRVSAQTERSRFTDRSLAGITRETGGTYRLHALLQPAGVPALPEPQPRPTAPGLQSALVVGLESESC
jgi:uncharacterized protein involved in type VI secretion and phage assembly